MLISNHIYFNVQLYIKILWVIQLLQMNSYHFMLKGVFKDISYVCYTLMKTLLWVLHVILGIFES